MLERTLLVFAGAALITTLAACPGERDPNVGSSSGTTTGGPGAVPGPGPAPGGPLAMLDPSTAKQETWALERGPAPFLNFEAQHLRISAGCRLPNGQMDCEALRFVRQGPTVELSPQDKMRAAPPGATVCMKIRQQLTTGRDPRGNEDGFCVFPDGSMIATGSLEYYALK